MSDKLPGSLSIGMLRETSLHTALKDWYARPGDQMETPVDGYVIDILRDGLLIEIQTRNFSSIRAKLARLTEAHAVRLIYPIPLEKWIVRVAADGEHQLARRKSPRRGRPEHLFAELVRFPRLLNNPNLGLEVLLTREEEIWRDDGRGSWRRKGWSIADRRLLEVVSSLSLVTPDDLRSWLPAGLPELFATTDLARRLALPARLAGKMTYCLREMGVLEITGKRRKAYLYRMAGDRER